MLEKKEQHFERAILVGIRLPDAPEWEPDYSLAELEALADTAGIETVYKCVQSRQGIDRTTFIGKGKVEEIKKLAESLSANVIIFDTELSPAQISQLEKKLGIPTLDRSDVILDIFARRAQTHEAKNQVELARLKYFLPRLKRHWTHLERQVGGVGVRGGPGEKQIEVDRRIIRKKIDKLERELKVIDKQRQIRNRKRREHFVVALVGYTNAGKSTLFNRLTKADVLVEDRLFATLDSTIRSTQLDPNTTCLMTDTVGFIRKLPHLLVASFRSTLEEACNADLLLHVVDISSPFLAEQIKAVDTVLKELDVIDKPTVYVLNKLDQADDDTHHEIWKLIPPNAPYVSVSAKTGENIDILQELIVETITEQFKEETFILPLNDQKSLTRLYEIGVVESKEYMEDEQIRVRCRAPISELERFKKQQLLKV